MSLLQADLEKDYKEYQRWNWWVIYIIAPLIVPAAVMAALPMLFVSWVAIGTTVAIAIFGKPSAILLVLPALYLLMSSITLVGLRWVNLNYRKQKR
jgi:hypothetical protein